MVDGERAKSAGVTVTDEQSVRDQYFSRLYDELRRIAVRELSRNSAATLSPTTLLHETFLNVSQRESAEFANRQRFMAYAGRAMRGLIIDHLRRGNRQKRGGEFDVITLADDLEIRPEIDMEADRLRDALEALGAIDERLAQCVDLRFFWGFSFSEIATLWNVSERTVTRDWDKARILLNRLITGAAADSDPPA
ncbi:MAG: ECF-type sigma factor [Steroidobacter sp.]